VAVPEVHGESAHGRKPLSASRGSGTHLTTALNPSRSSAAAAKPPPHLALARAARARARPSIHELTVSAVRSLTDDAVTVSFAVPEHLADAFRFTAGQHLTVLWETAGGETRRSYSLCVPEGSETLTIAVKRMDGGAFSTYANEQLQVGDLLRVMTPTGTFVVKPRAGRFDTYVAVAAGSGITPILSMIATILAKDDTSRVVLLYQNRSRASTMFFRELTELSVRYADRLVVHHVWSRQHEPGHLLEGRLDRSSIGRFASHVDSVTGLHRINEWLLCGPADLMDEVGVALEACGIDPSRIRRELFFDPHADAGDDGDDRATRPLVQSKVTVRVGGDEFQFPLSSLGESILSATTRLCPEIPYSCQDGVCATCRARVLDGQAVMDRCSGLDRGEIADGYILTCQAHPTSEVLLLDFDA
jgi:ring-1,2-phenylacetyl-CoA epoxidase subunit PaaE